MIALPSGQTAFEISHLKPRISLAFCYLVLWRESIASRRDEFFVVEQPPQLATDDHSQIQQSVSSRTYVLTSHFDPEKAMLKSDGSCKLELHLSPRGYC
jgi:hypothetical protein